MSNLSCQTPRPLLTPSQTSASFLRLPLPSFSASSFSSTTQYVCPRAAREHDATCTTAAARRRCQRYARVPKLRTGVSPVSTAVQHWRSKAYAPVGHRTRAKNRPGLPVAHRCTRYSDDRLLCASWRRIVTTQSHAQTTRLTRVHALQTPRETRPEFAQAMPRVRSPRRATPPRTTHPTRSHPSARTDSLQPP